MKKEVSQQITYKGALEVGFIVSTALICSFSVVWLVMFFHPLELPFFRTGSYTSALFDNFVFLLVISTLIFFALIRFFARKFPTRIHIAALAFFLSVLGMIIFLHSPFLFLVDDLLRPSDSNCMLENCAWIGIPEIPSQQLNLGKTLTAFASFYMFFTLISWGSYKLRQNLCKHFTEIFSVSLVVFFCIWITSSIYLSVQHTRELACKWEPVDPSVQLGNLREVCPSFAQKIQYVQKNFKGQFMSQIGIEEPIYYYPD